MKKTGRKNLKLSIDQGGLFYKHAMCKYVGCAIALSVNHLLSKATCSHSCELLFLASLARRQSFSFVLHPDTDTHRHMQYIIPCDQACFINMLIANMLDA